MQRERSDDADGTAGVRSLCCLSGDFHVTQLYVQYIFLFNICSFCCHILELIYIYTHKITVYTA